jgi:hypothetical protein
MQTAIAETGAVLMGRRTFEMGDPGVQEVGSRTSVRFRLTAS